MHKLGRFLLGRPMWVVTLVVFGIALLPAAVWLDLRNLSDQNLNAQATTLGRVISVFRTYYSTNVVNRVNAADGRAYPLHNFTEVDGGIPIPATLSINLGEAISAEQGNVNYRFVSDFPFVNRVDHNLTASETESLQQFRATRDPEAAETSVFGNIWDRTITVATPVVMGAGCVACHNSHPESPKTDWAVGDIRGIQSISVHQPLALSLSSFKWLLAYLAVAGTAGLVFAASQFSLAGQFTRMNADLEEKNNFLANVSGQISKYLSPQVFASIFSGEKGAEISTERKRLTVFFSDIKDFTATTERLQPEELTELLNEYFSEMSQIAEKHGATIDKFIGDAIVAFFGDPTTKGTAEDAKACVAMALEMQQRLGELNAEWLKRGFEHPFRARMGINTGYCNVGNFGSDTRMDYTVIGAEANLAARLEGIAEPGGIVMSYETFAHVRDVVDALPLEPTRFKGISREVVPYRVIMTKAGDENGVSLREVSPGLKLILDVPKLDADGRNHAREALKSALAMVEPEEAKGAKIKTLSATRAAGKRVLLRNQTRRKKL